MTKVLLRFGWMGVAGLALMIMASGTAAATSVATPEIDSSALGSALAAVVAGGAMLRARFRK